MYPPVTTPTLGIFAILPIMLLAFIEVGVVQTAYQRLGISPRVVTLLLLAMILGSYVNVPIATISAPRLIQNQVISFWGIPYVVPQIPHRTEIAINVGGAFIPIIVSIYILGRFGDCLRAAIATLIVALVVCCTSRVVPGVGVAVPTLAPGVVAAVAAYLVRRRGSPAVMIAYVAGTLGMPAGRGHREPAHGGADTRARGVNRRCGHLRRRVHLGTDCRGALLNGSLLRYHCWAIVFNGSPTGRSLQAGYLWY
jgi:uncharacterized membrane protein